MTAAQDNRRGFWHRQIKDLDIAALLEQAAQLEAEHDLLLFEARCVQDKLDVVNATIVTKMSAEREAIMHPVSEKA